MLSNGLRIAPQGPQKVRPELEAFIKKCFAHSDDFLLDDEAYTEGRKVLKTHIVSERNPSVVQKAKENFKNSHNGKLYCEICHFDFSETYGSRGDNFIEAHHIKPVSKMKLGEKTSVADLIMVCSNCHSMIHREPLYTSREELETLLLKK